MTIRRLACLLCALVLMNGCATTDQHLTAAKAPAPPPPLAPQVQSPQTSQSAVQTTRPAILDPVDQLVQQADWFYARGMADYQAGNLEKSKREFDQALDTLLESGHDIQGDERLTAEFDKLEENVYTLEAASLERGDSLSVQSFEPAPLDSFSGLTFPVDPRTQQRAREELQSVHSDLPLVSNDYVDGVMSYLESRGRGYMDNVLRGVGKYGQIIGEALRKQGLPQDLIYLAAGESAFNPLAVSNKQCVGIWQFSAGTGALYGLKRDRWVDERRDPVKSTEAAAHHLKDLYQTFGDWYLVMAAYDSGAGNVQRAIERTGYADYWELRSRHALLAETENYVPIFLATALIAKDPKAYGFDTPPDPPMAMDTVVVSVPTDLRLIADLIDSPVDDLVKLNPSLLRWTTPANDSAFVLNLPAGTRDQYEQAIASIPPEKRIWWRAHKVQVGETLASVAAQFHITTASLAQANQLTAGASLDPGTHLVVPLATGRDASLARVRETVPYQLVHYRVREGDTLDLIADRYDVTGYQIRRWNGLLSSKLVVGRTLRLYVGGHAAVAARRPAPKPAAQTAHPPAATAPSRKTAPPKADHTAPVAPAKDNKPQQ